MPMLHIYVFPKLHHERMKHTEKLKEFYGEYPNTYCLDSIINILLKLLYRISIQLFFPLSICQFILYSGCNSK